MLNESYFKKPKDIAGVIAKVRDLAKMTGPVRLMEICGTHTMAISRSGIRGFFFRDSTDLRPRLPGMCDAFRGDVTKYLSSVAIKIL